MSILLFWRRSAPPLVPSVPAQLAVSFTPTYGLTIEWSAPEVEITVDQQSVLTLDLDEG